MSPSLQKSISREGRRPLREATAQVSGPVESDAQAVYDSAAAAGEDAITGILFGGRTLCAHAGCGRAVARRSGPGRPPRFCSAQCRQAARHEARSAATQASTRPPRHTSRFSEVFRAEVERADISLQDISDLVLQEDGIMVSRSTLSSWQCGRTPRRGTEEQDNRIYAVERVLRLHRSQLLLLLDEPSIAGSNEPAQTGGDDEVRALRVLAGQLGGVSNCIIIAVEDEQRVIDHKVQDRTVKQVVRAIAPNADCYWTIYDPDASGPDVPFTPVQGCRIGRKVPKGDLIAVELLFDRILQPGETHTFSFRIDEEELTQPVRDCRRWAGPPALELLKMSVHFDEKSLPRQVSACQWATDDQLARPARPVRVVEGVARLRMPHPPAGLYGLSWRW